MVGRLAPVAPAARYVIQRRPTFWQARDRWLIEHETPAFSKTIRSPRAGIGPWRLDVPLLTVFSNEQRRRAIMKFDRSGQNGWPLSHRFLD